MNKYQQRLEEVQQEIQKVVIGKDEVIRQVLMAILARGHVLLEDIPGVGKTTLALAFSKVLSLGYHRMQFTPDVMPADVIGFSMYNKKTQDFEYRAGAIMCNLLLADEINRTSPKTQSALLEAMEEGSVTVDGVTHTLPDPFFVIATENPIGSAGTQKLPESQLDRFMIKLSMGYPDEKSEAVILKGDSAGAMDDLAPKLSLEDIREIQDSISRMHVEDSMYQYITALAWATRRSDNLRAGISPRGTKAVLRMARAHACLEGRDYLVPEDVLEVFQPVAGHRVILSATAKAKGLLVEDILKDISGSVPMPDRVG